MTAAPASLSVSLPASGLRSKIATLHPSSASLRLNARPMPCPPPVTIATLSFSPRTLFSPYRSNDQIQFRTFRFFGLRASHFEQRVLQCLQGPRGLRQCLLRNPIED